MFVILFENLSLSELTLIIFEYGMISLKLEGLIFSLYGKVSLFITVFGN